jgi:2-oxoglutarate dehydrogenase E2 component (dihydrolipoamide succinyltransferase)
MKQDILVPSVGESVTQGTLAAWLKGEGQSVQEGEELFELETDKATVAVPAPASGVLHIQVEAGRDVQIGAVVGVVETAGRQPSIAARQPAVAAGVETAQAAGPAPVPGAGAAPPGDSPPLQRGRLLSGQAGSPAPAAAARKSEPAASPLARQILAQRGLEASRIEGTGPGGRITREDALRAAAEPAIRGQPAAGEPALRGAGPAPGGSRGEAPQGSRRGRETRQPMSRLRRALAERLVAARRETALTTTFNEADLGAVQELRRRYGEDFEKRHGVRLGLMSFFLKACCRALQAVPEVNSRIEGDDIVTCSYYDIGVAVSTERGLVVPVLREAEALSFAEIEKKLAELAQRARERRLGPEDLAGGTFTITNGGVFGSLLSAPLPNYPQAAILGMHAIQRRPVAREDQVVIRPMMYLALSYDHRLIDGREAVQFLVKVKQLVEEPERLLLEQ